MSRSSSREGQNCAWLYLLPAILIFAVFYYRPLLEDAYLSFFQWNMISPTMKFVGLANYQQIFASKEFLKILCNTGLLVLLLLIFNFLLPYGFAFVLTQLIRNKKVQSLFRSAFFLPSTISLAVASIIFLWMYNPLAGPVSLVLKAFGLESPRWFKESGLVIFALSTIIGWKAFGYNMIVLIAAMVSVPRELIEAAKLENASNWTIFRRIIVPMTSPTALYVFTITIIFGLQYMLVPTNMLTQGGPDQGSSNIVYIVYQYALVFFQTGKSAAFAMLCMAVYVIFLFLKSRFLDKRVHYEN
ncbi:carbohydrate ABC transporter permease [Acidaminococcus sp. LBK-2]|uniref:carbohydrate ABC transporter permease n=1 Tax=Acidaminococcus sp. LBK-2 TaxID=3456956 RepID=UPI003FA4832B